MTDIFPHQTARVIGITYPETYVYNDMWLEDTEYIGPVDQEDLITFAARVSNPANQTSNETERLLNYLRNNAHWSPFEMVNVLMEIETTRDIARQLLRHRSFSFQEFSQRYAEVLDDFVIREARRQDDKNRQNSIDDMSMGDQVWWKNVQEQHAASVRDQYEQALKRGIAKEQARAILPEGMTPSRLYVNGTLRSWIHYIDLREKNGTQLEHQDIAIKCKEAIEFYCPTVFN